MLAGQFHFDSREEYERFCAILAPSIAHPGTRNRLFFKNGFKKIKVKQTQQSHPYTNPARVSFTLFSSPKGQMLELNLSRSNKSTMLREEIVSVSIVEINLKQAMSERERENRSWHLRLE
jgi:hypothetical protein